MPLSYSDIMSLSTGRNASLYEAKIPYTGYNATLYARWLPYAVLTPMFSSAILILSLFLPWFSVSQVHPARSCYFSGFQVAKGISGTSSLLNGPCSVYHQGQLDYVLSFPWLWLLPAIGIFQVFLSAFLLQELLLKDKGRAPEISKFVRLSFVPALLIEIVYLVLTLVAALSVANTNTAVSAAASPSFGLWVCLLTTLLAGGICLSLYPKLSWCWALAEDEAEQAAERAKARDRGISRISATD